MAEGGRKLGSGNPVIVRSKKPMRRSAETGRLAETNRSEAVEHHPVGSENAAERVEAVMRGAAESGLTLAKNGRIAGRVSSELIAAAKARTGLQSDTELVAFALANVALKDDFAQVFRDVKGTVDPDLDLAF